MTKSFDDYMNDPRIKNESMGLRITHAMRLKVQDETKGMTPAERTAYYNGGQPQQFASGKAKEAHFCTPIVDMGDTEGI